MQVLTKKVGDYLLDVKQLLGKGTFGEVYLGQDKLRGKVIAIKQIAVKSKPQSEIDKVLKIANNEIQIMKSIQHVNVVSLYDVQQTQNNLYIMMEYCNEGTLDAYIKGKCPSKPHFLAESEVLIIIKQVVNGFRALYEKKIVHRDLKPQNLLMHDGIVKIGDFGFSKVMESSMEDTMLKTYAGSPLYMAPQILKETFYSSKSDVWSLGIIFYEALYGATPWLATSILDLVQKLESQSVRFPAKPAVSAETQSLITKMLERDEAARLSWEDVFRHPYFNPEMEIEESNFLQLSVEKMRIQEDELRRSNIKRQLYFHEQNVIQNLQHGQQVQNRVQQYIIIEDADQRQSPLTQQNLSSGSDKKAASPRSAETGLRQQEDEFKQKRVRQRISDWIVHRKNKSVFLNTISQQWFDLNDSVLKGRIEAAYYYAFLFITTKYQTQILYKMGCRLKAKQLDSKKPQKKFSQEDWATFCKGKEYAASRKTIENDYSIIKPFLAQVVPRTQVALQGSSDKLAANVLSICHMEMTLKNQFDPIFSQLVGTILFMLKEIIRSMGNEQDKKLLQFAKHLQNSLVMSEIFKFKGPKQIDFFKYYEEVERESVPNLLLSLNI